MNRSPEGINSSWMAVQPWPSFILGKGASLNIKLRHRAFGGALRRATTCAIFWPALDADIIVRNSSERAITEINPTITFFRKAVRAQRLPLIDHPPVPADGPCTYVHNGVLHPFHFPLSPPPISIARLGSGPQDFDFTFATSSSGGWYYNPQSHHFHPRNYRVFPFHGHQLCLSCFFIQRGMEAFFPICVFGPDLWFPIFCINGNVICPRQALSNSVPFRHWKEKRKTDWSWSECYQRRRCTFSLGKLAEGSNKISGRRSTVTPLTH